MLESSALQLLKQFAKIYDITSNVLLLNTGVPLISILGPLLFIICINDFSQAGTLFKFIIHADGTFLVSTLGSFTIGSNNPDAEYMINTELQSGKMFINYY